MLCACFNVWFLNVMGHLWIALSIVASCTLLVRGTYYLMQAQPHLRPAQGFLSG